MANRNAKPPKHRQFGQPNGNPRHSGAWKKEDTPRFKLEQMMKLTKKELTKIQKDSKSPFFERKLAEAIMDGEWKDIEKMINQVYGTPAPATTAPPGGQDEPFSGIKVYLPDNGRDRT